MYTALEMFFKDTFEPQVTETVAATLACMEPASLELLRATEVLTDDQCDVFMAKDVNRLPAIITDLIAKLQALVESYERACEDKRLTRVNFKVLLRRLIPLDVIEYLAIIL